MADYTFDGAEAAPRRRSVASFTHWAGAFMSLGLVVGLDYAQHTLDVAT